MTQCTQETITVALDAFVMKFFATVILTAGLMAVLMFVGWVTYIIIKNHKAILNKISKLYRRLK